MVSDSGLAVGLYNFNSLSNLAESHVTRHAISAVSIPSITASQNSFKREESNFETALLVYQLAALAMFQRRNPNTPVRLTRLFAIQTCSVTPLLTASSLCLYLAGISHECGDG